MNRSLLAGIPDANRSIFEYVAPQDREPLRRCLRQALRKRAPVEIEVRQFTLRQTSGPVILAIEPILSAEGVLASACGRKKRQRPDSRRK